MKWLDEFRQQRRDRKLRREFEGFWSRHPDLHTMPKEEGWINFLVMEELGEAEVRRQLTLGTF